MPYAQWGYHPDLGRGLGDVRERFPADFIAEAIDQTRGWFYTLMAEGVLCSIPRRIEPSCASDSWSMPRAARCRNRSGTPWTRSR